MNRLILLLFALLSACYCQADNLSVPMAGNANGKYLNSVVQLLGDGVYDASSGTVMSTGIHTAIKVNSINFGDEIYTYNSFSIEYTHSQDLSESSFFDIYLEDTADPIASVQVEKTGDGEYKTATAGLSQSVFGRHNIYIRWRGHNSAIKTFIINEITPFVQVPLVRSFSTKTFKFSKTVFEELDGVHRLKMLWRNHNAVVRAVYLDKINTDPTSVKILEEDYLDVIPFDRGFRIVSKYPIGNIELYSLSGMKILNLNSVNCIEEVFVEPGTYILRIVNSEKQVVIRKMVI